MCKLIVNADDFGLSRAVNRGIIKSHLDGITTSTSLMANGTAFEDALNRLIQAPQMGVGLHLNVIRGRPVTALRFLPHITNPQGFLRMNWLNLLMQPNRAIRHEIELEYRNQIEKALDRGIQLTHLDGEKHHHRIPWLFELTTRIAKAYQIKSIRCALEAPHFFSLASLTKVMLLNSFLPLNRHGLRQFSIKSTDHQIGIGLTGNMTLERLAVRLINIKNGLNELCVHPGYVDTDHLRETQHCGPFFIDAHREEEIRILTDKRLQKIIRQKKIHLIHYGDI